MPNICIIPARGGSKRIPRKNIKQFLGKPMISYAIRLAQSANIFDEIMVSTDDDEIAAIAKSYGANVPFKRNQKNANDHATLSDVLFEVLEAYRGHELVYENFCCLLPTTPLLISSYLVEAYLTLSQVQVDCVFSVLPYEAPIQRALKIDEGFTRFCWPEYEFTRTQDCEPHYHDAGAFYWCKTEAFLKHKRIVMERSKGVILDPLHAQDIDTLQDWSLAEVKYGLQERR